VLRRSFASTLTWDLQQLLRFGVLHQRRPLCFRQNSRKQGASPVLCKLPRIPTSDIQPLTFHLRYIPSPGYTYCRCRWHEQHGIAVIITRSFLHTEEEKSEVDITSPSSIDFPLLRRWSHDSHSQPPRPAPVNENS
jgi:hypothetical protein